jgi:hypothetical protein
MVSPELEQTPGVNGQNYRPRWSTQFPQVNTPQIPPRFGKFYVAPGIGPVR